MTCHTCDQLSVAAGAGAAATRVTRVTRLTIRSGCTAIPDWCTGALFWYWTIERERETLHLFQPPRADQMPGPPEGPGFLSNIPTLCHHWLSQMSSESSSILNAMMQAPSNPTPIHPCCIYIIIIITLLTSRGGN